MLQLATKVEGGSTPESTIPLTQHLRRRPDGISGEILCLSSEDHYLRVHTMDGSSLILSRLSDAVADLADAEGRQVHRSWWVSRHAINAVSTTDGRREFVLTNGLRVPIGRTYVSGLREAGWL